MNKSRQPTKRPQQKNAAKLAKLGKNSKATKQQKRSLTTKRVLKSSRSATASPVAAKSSPFSTLFSKSAPSVSTLSSATKSKAIVAKVLPKFTFSPLTSAKASFSSANPNYQQDGKEVEQRIFQVLNSFDKVNKEKLSSNAHLQNDLGLDSLDRVEVVLAVEEEFNMEFTDEQSDKFASVNEIVDFVARQPNIHLRSFKPDDI